MVRMIQGLMIRPAVASDAHAIRALIGSQAHHRTPDPVGPEPPEFLAGFAPRTIQAHIASTDHRYLVALLEEQLVGVIGIRNGDRIMHLFVAGPFQQHGIARALWDRARSELPTRSGGTRVDVNSSISAIPVYERFGFTAIGPRVERSGVTYVPMQLVIADLAERSDR